VISRILRLWTAYLRVNLVMRTVYWVILAISSGSEPPLERPSVRSLRQFFEGKNVEYVPSTGVPDSAKDKSDEKHINEIGQPSSDEEVAKNRFSVELPLSAAQPEPSVRPALHRREIYREFNRWRGF